MVRQSIAPRPSGGNFVDLRPVALVQEMFGANTATNARASGAQVNIDPRPLPNASDAEVALCCALLIDPPRVLADAGDLAPVDFSQHLAAELWRVALALHKDGSTVDLATIRAKLPADADDLRAFLSEVVTSETGAPLAAGDYAAAILAAKRRRDLYQLGHALQEGAADNGVDLDTIERETMRRLVAIAPTPQGHGVEVVTAADLLAKDFPDAADIVAGILPKRARLILSAPAKLGKTRFALGLCLAIAAGKSAMGFTITEPAKGLYLYGEGGERMMQDRLRKMLAGFDVEETALRERLLLHNAHGLKMTNPAHVEQLREAIAKHQPAIVAIDPLYKFHTGDESSVRDMTAFFDPLDALIADYGVAVLLIHHHGKGTGDGLATQAHRNRGSSTIADWADSLLTLTFEDTDAGVVKLAYTLRHAEEPDAAAFYRNPETLWFDPLPDHQFAGRGSKAKVTDAEVAGVIGKGATAYRQLVEKLRERFDVSDGTARATIRRATNAGTIRKDEGTGLYVSTR
jgi:hypothetical protein